MGRNGLCLILLGCCMLAAIADDPTTASTKTTTKVSATTKANQTAPTTTTTIKPAGNATTKATGTKTTTKNDASTTPPSTTTQLTTTTTPTTTTTAPKSTTTTLPMKTRLKDVFNETMEPIEQMAKKIKSQMEKTTKAKEKLMKVMTNETTEGECIQGEKDYFSMIGHLTNLTELAQQFHDNLTKLQKDMDKYTGACKSWTLSSKKKDETKFDAKTTTVIVITMLILAVAAIALVVYYTRRRKRLANSYNRFGMGPRHIGQEDLNPTGPSMAGDDNDTFGEFHRSGIENGDL